MSIPLHLNVQLQKKKKKMQYTNSGFPPSCSKNNPKQNQTKLQLLLCNYLPLPPALNQREHLPRGTFQEHAQWATVALLKQWASFYDNDNGAAVPTLPERLQPSHSWEMYHLHNRNYTESWTMKWIRAETIERKDGQKTTEKIDKSGCSEKEISHWWNKLSSCWYHRGLGGEGTRNTPICDLGQWTFLL